MTQAEMPSMIADENQDDPPWKIWLQGVLLALVLYVFLVSIGLLGA